MTSTARQARNSYPRELAQLAVLLARRHSPREVAAALDVPLSTVYRWLHPRQDSASANTTALPELVEACATRGIVLGESLQQLAACNDSHDPAVQVRAEVKVEHPTQATATNGAAIAIPLHARAKARVSDEVRRRLELVRQKIVREYFTHLSCDDFGRIATMSKYNLINRFKRLYGVSPYRYLLQVRIEHAKKLLRSTHASAGAIATAVGFDSQSSLGKSFRRIAGCGLSEFRRDVFALAPDAELPAEVAPRDPAAL
jgi:AraC-like DNA-binding protein